MWLWATCAYGCYVQDKHGGLSASQRQKNYIRRQIFLYLKPKVAEIFRGADILKDWLVWWLSYMTPFRPDMSGLSIKNEED